MFNNEIGTVLDLEQVAHMSRRYGACFILMGSVGIGKMKLNLEEIPILLLPVRINFMV
jgi:cysteine sulfinate desulfinase/cysteine desulfurase-like protein